MQRISPNLEAAYLSAHCGGIDTGLDVQPLTHLNSHSTVHIQSIYDNSSSGGGDLGSMSSGVRIQVR